MDWKKAAIEDLRKYNALKQSLVAIPEKVRALDCQLISVRAGISEQTPVQGGTSKAEDRIISNIAEQERLRDNYRIAFKEIRRIERGFEALSANERHVLQRVYIDNYNSGIERLKEELGYEQSEIYRIKDRALKSFTIAMYGILEF